MKNFKHIVAVFTMFLVTGLMSAEQVKAQGDVMGDVRSAVKAGSSKELARNFNAVVELTLDGKDATNYSNTQAEFVMKNFFSKNVPMNFDYSHQGASEKGQRYAIGTYTAKSGSYTVLVRLKETNGRYLIQSMNFIKD